MLFVLAGVIEKALQTDLQLSVFIRAEADSADKCFIAQRSLIIRGLGAAKLHKIQRGASHDEHRLKILVAGEGIERQHMPAVGVDRKLAHTDEFTFRIGTVGKGIRNVFRTDACRKRLLLGL